MILCAGEKNTWSEISGVCYASEDCSVFDYEMYDEGNMPSNLSKHASVIIWKCIS